jgi:hypothetical protein
MKLFFRIFVSCLILSGCASRDFIRQNALSPAINLYNRNFIVSAPTKVGNYICGAPFFLISSGIDSIAPDKARNENYYSFINGIYTVPATLCGAIMGVVFVPISYVCPENPWYENAKSYYREWSCAPPEGGPFLKTKNNTYNGDAP